MYETWIDRHFGKIMLSFFGTIILLLYMVFSYHADLALRHYKQCLDDGKKEYECYAIVYNGGRR